MRKYSKGNCSKPSNSGLRKAITPAEARSSVAQKYKQVVNSHGRRPSNERVGRVSLVTANNTPSKFVTPIQNNKLLFPPTTSSRKQSTDTVRSSFGGKGRKEGFPVNDANYKMQCIDKIVDFLEQNHYDHQFSRTMLKSPTGKDFTQLFSFIYKHLDSEFTMPVRFEDELPRVLKAMKYPVHMPKSSFVNVGSPHTWPSVLSMLSWLIDVIEFHNNGCEGNCVAFTKDFNDDPLTNLELKLKSLIDQFMSQSTEDEKQRILQEYRNNIYELEGVGQEDLISLQLEEEKIKSAMNSLGSTKREVEEVQNQLQQLHEDKQKLEKFTVELKQHISLRMSERGQLALQKGKAEEDVESIRKEIARFQYLKEEQKLNVLELKKFKNDLLETKTLTIHQQNEGQKFKEEIWSCEMQISRGQEQLSSAVCKYNTLCSHFQLESCDIPGLNIQSNLDLWKTEVLPLVNREKRKVKEATFAAENEVTLTKMTKGKVEMQVQELEKEIFKLEKQQKRLEEEAAATKEEMDLEEHRLKKEYERISENISHVQKGSQIGLYEKHKELEDAKCLYESWKLKYAEEKENGNSLITGVIIQLKQLREEKKKMLEEYYVEIGEALIRLVEEEC